MTAPASRTSDAVEGNACTTLDLRFISRFVRSWTLLVRRRFQCDGGKSRYARASGSASSRIAAALGQHPSSMSHAAWCMAVTVAASRPRNTCETILPTRRLSCQEPASRMQSRMRWTAQRCHAAPWKTSAAAATRPACASETTSSTPETPRSRIFLRNASHESHDSVSTASTPRTRLQPPASQPMAVCIP